MYSKKENLKLPFRSTFRKDKQLPSRLRAAEKKDEESLIHQFI